MLIYELEWDNKYVSLLNISFTLADPLEGTVIEYSDRSLTVLWPRIIMAKFDKKNI